MIKLRVPATTANMGPGFDVIGLALDLYNTFTFSMEGGDCDRHGLGKFIGARRGHDQDVIGGAVLFRPVVGHRRVGIH